jgi:hypothetical protein
MIVAVFASLLLVSAAQDPAAYPEVTPPSETSEPQNDGTYPQEPVYGAEPAEAAEQAAEAAEQAAEAVEAAAQQTSETAEQAAEGVEQYVEEPQVCRRQTTYEFGRQRSRKVCRPRSEW